MKIQVLKDSTGHVVASFERRATGSHLEPQVQAGQKVEEIEVPENYVANLHSIYKAAAKRA
jgi:hypothetical protein